MKQIVFVLAILGVLFTASCANERGTTMADPEKTGYPARPFNSAQPIMHDNSGFDKEKDIDK